MKKFEQLGRSLSKNEQRMVMGGGEDGPLCGTGVVGTCHCVPGVFFYCCITCPVESFADPSCITLNGCTETNVVCTNHPCA